MRLQYTIDDLRKYYQKTVSTSEQLLKRGKYESAIKCIRAAALLQYNLNDIFVDSKVNLLLKSLGEKLVSIPESLGALDNNCVFFIDYFGIDNRGLTQQYLDALVAQLKGERIIYIHESSFTNRGINIKKYLKTNDIVFYELGTVSELNKVSLINQLVLKYKPSRVFFHLHAAKSLAPIIALYPLESIIKYQINITDHAFWLGGPDFFDYSIEFRDYGASVSERYRGFKEEQIKILPYYPWQESGQFAGFPIETKDKIVLFSGGYLYKIEGDGDTFLDLAKAITEMNDNVVFFLAGNGKTNYFDDYVLKNGLKNKFYYIGDRHDISDVFRRIDIFLGTYPHGGGLMTQLAAINSKPILLYKSFDIAELFLNKRKVDFIFNTKKELLLEANKLVQDSSYRNNRGQFVKGLIITKEQFRQNFKLILDNVINKREKIDEGSPEMSYIYSSYLKRINEGFFGIYLESLLFFSTHKVLGFKPAINILLNIKQIKQLR